MLNRFYGYPTFTLIFRRSLYNLVGCSACMEVSYRINVPLRAFTDINEKDGHEAWIRTCKFQCLETPGDPFGVSNTTETLGKKENHQLDFRYN